jgi:hypothetical protein
VGGRREKGRRKGGRKLGGRRRGGEGEKGNYLLKDNITAFTEAHLLQHQSVVTVNSSWLVF